MAAITGPKDTIGVLSGLISVNGHGHQDSAKAMIRKAAI
jgi:hypothetical protein